jgi:hypothetical protein
MDCLDNFIRPRGRRGLGAIIAASVQGTASLKLDSHSFSSFFAFRRGSTSGHDRSRAQHPIHLRPARLDMNGQSIENKIFSAPISAIEQVRAEFENAPLVVSQKCSR